MLYMAADHAGFELKKRVLVICKTNDIKIEDVYDTLDLKDDYPDVGQTLAQKMFEEGDDSKGIAICGTAEGICMALNRFDYIRAATVDSPYITSIVRRHNQANVICIPGPYSKKELSDKQLLEIIETFLYTEPDLDPRHVRRVNKLSTL
jgi:ribose 5-phosphate isomerase B